MMRDRRRRPWSIGWLMLAMFAAPPRRADDAPPQLEVDRRHAGADRAARPAGAGARGAGRSRTAGRRSSSGSSTSYPHGSAFRYDIVYYGLEPGRYDLKDLPAPQGRLADWRPAADPGHDRAAAAAGPDRAAPAGARIVAVAGRLSAGSW